jgi:tRNA(fMet)-specific endonuclease VapC
MCHSFGGRASRIGCVGGKPAGTLVCQCPNPPNHSYRTTTYRPARGPRTSSTPADDFSPVKETRPSANTHIVSRYLRRTSLGLEERINAELEHHTLVMSVIARAELRFGQAGLAPEDRRRPLIDGFLRRLACAEWSMAAADHRGALKQPLKTRGTPIGDADTQIAAHALTEKWILVTHNTRHFKNVPGSKLKNWMA